MKTDILQNDIKIFAWKKPIMILIIGLILVDIGIRCIDLMYVSEAPLDDQPATNNTELVENFQPAEQGENGTQDEALPALAVPQSKINLELEHSQADSGATEVVSLTSKHNTSRYHELPWHFSSILESLNGIMSADTTSLGIYIAEAQSAGVELFQQVLLRAVFQRWSELSLAELTDFINNGIDFNDSRFNSLVVEEAIATLVQIAQKESSQEELLNLLTPGKSPPQVIAALLATWASDDPRSALAWLDQNNHDGVLDQHLPNTLQALIDSDPDAAQERIRQLPTVEQQPYLAKLDMPESVEVVPVASPQQAIEMLDGLPQGQRQARQEDILMQWFSDDAAAAANWIANTQDPALQESLENMIADLPRIDLAAAQDVFNTLKPTLQQQLVEGIARESALQDESVTQAWIESLDNTAHRFLAESSILQVTLEKDPGRALEMASEYSGENRLEFLQIAVNGVQHNQPELVTQWMTSAALTGDERSKLQSMISQSF